MSTVRSDFAWTISLSGAAFLASLAGQIVISYHFGASAELDAYWAAFALMNMLAFPLGPLREALVSEVHRRKERNLEAASDYFSRALGLMLLIAALSMALGWLLVKPITALAISNRQPELRVSASVQLAWLLPGIAFLALSETLNTILIAYRRVVLQALARFLGALTTLAVLALLSGMLKSFVLPVGFLAAQVATVSIQARILGRFGLSCRPRWPRHLGGRFMAVSGALFATYGAAQAYLVYEKHVLSGFAVGWVSAFQYAVSLTNVLITLIGVALANVLWSRFLKYAASDQQANIFFEVTVASRLVFLIIGGLCAIAWLNASSLIELILARGAFDSAAIIRTTETLRMAIFSAIPASVSLVMGRALISLGAARSIVATGLATSLAGALTLATAYLLDNSHLALAHWLIANVVNLGIHALLLARICNARSMDFRKALAWVIRWAGALGVAVVAALQVRTSPSGIMGMLLDFALTSVTFVVVFTGLALVGGLFRGLSSISGNQ